MTVGLTPRIDALTPGTQGFVDQSATIAAGTGNFITTIVGRAPIPNIAADLRASFGVERIMIQSIVQLQNEFGASGEPVYAAVNDERGLIRFVGSWANEISTSGSLLYTVTSGDYIEVVFYGTGLNLLTKLDAGAHAISVTLNGNSYGTISPSTSTILNSRNYASNLVYNVVSGQNLGVHTVKLAASTSPQVVCYGFEILNANASGNININPGTAYCNGKQYNNLLADANPYNPLPATWYTFTLSSTANATAGATYTNNTQTFTVLYTIVGTSTLVCAGTGAPAGSGNLSKTSGIGDTTIAFASSTNTTQKGYRVVQYLNADGTTGNAWTPVAAAPAYLTNVNHANEEIARTFHWREFGAGRSDDFSATNLTASGNYAFTLDDGTTTLVGYQVASVSSDYPDGLRLNTPSTATLTFTFVGCGLDVDMYAFGAAGNTVSIDGGSALAVPIQTVGIGANVPIVSGLPYGTHTAVFTRGGAGIAISFKSFKVYQPKTPTIPTSSIAVGSYNVMGSFVANTTAAVLNTSTGVLRKSSSREMVYVDGTGGTTAWVASLSPNGQPSGFEFASDKLNASIQYTFFGTGFDFRSQSQSVQSNNIAVTINGVALNASYPGASNITYSVYGAGVTYGGGSANSSALLSTVGSNILTLQNGSVINGVGFTISGLPLGEYTVKFNNGTASIYLKIYCIDIITPIHSYKSNLYADLQNTLTVGSNSLMDVRNTQPIPLALPQNKAWAQAVGVYGAGATVTSANLIPMIDMSGTLKTSGGPLQISYNASMYHSVAATLCTCQVYVDGIAVGTPKVMSSPGAGATYVFEISDNIIIPASQGYHKIDVYVATGAITLTLYVTNRSMTVKEL